VSSIVVVGVLVLIAAFLVSWHLPPDPTGDSDVRVRASTE
jgi:hypothetical protein